MCLKPSLLRCGWGKFNSYSKHSEAGGASPQSQGQRVARKNVSAFSRAAYRRKLGKLISCNSAPEPQRGLGGKPGATWELVQLLLELRAVHFVLNMVPVPHPGCNPAKALGRPGYTLSLPDPWRAPPAGGQSIPVSGPCILFAASRGVFYELLPVVPAMRECVLTGN